MSQITYANKQAISENPDIPITAKVTDDDMNEIKQVVNENETIMNNMIVNEQSNSQSKTYSCNYVNDIILNKVYPIGSIYMSVNSANPSILFGGTWVVWGTGRVPVGVDTSQTNFNTVEKTGGEKTHTLTAGEMPNKEYVNYVTSNPSAYGSATTSGFQIATFTGGGQAHNNLQPYITCYMWKRTA